MSETLPQITNGKQELTPAALLEKVVIGGDLSKLLPAERLQYYNAVCHSIGLNPLSRPFEYITLNGKLVLYARKDATEQLRALHNISVTKLERDITEGVYTVTAYLKNGHTQREDSSIGAVNVEGLKGEAKANAMMKAETKAKRRGTLSICGLGMLDETEIETIPGAQPFVEHEIRTNGRTADLKLNPAETELDLARQALASLMNNPQFTEEQRTQCREWLTKKPTLEQVKKKLQAQKSLLEIKREPGDEPTVIHGHATAQDLPGLEAF